MDVYFFFEWLDNSFLASMSKAYGGVFAVVQMFHLLSLAMLGGTVLLSDLRLLGVMMRDVPSESVVANTQRWFTIALIGAVLSGGGAQALLQRDVLGQDDGLRHRRGVRLHHPPAAAGR